MVMPANMTVMADTPTYPYLDNEGYIELTAVGSSSEWSNYKTTNVKDKDGNDVKIDEGTFPYTFGKYLYTCRCFEAAMYRTGDNNKGYLAYNWINKEYFLKKNDPFPTDEDRTSLEVGGTEDQELSSGRTFLYNRVRNWSELRYFENVTDLTITKIENIEAIQFPARIKKLTIENCIFLGDLDLSSYADLEELVITNTTLASKDETYTITGLDKLKKLKKLKLDGTNITSIQLFNDEGDVDSTGLELSAVGCTSLKTVNTGKYKLINGYTDKKCTNQYAPSFYRCSNLESLTVKGIADKESQTFDIRECVKLNTVNMSYDFTAAENRLVIETNPIDNADGTAIFGREEGSEAGLYTLKAAQKSFFYKAYQNESYSAYFDKVNSEILSGMAEYVVFSQDFHDSLFDNGIWKDKYFKIWDVPKRENYKSDYAYADAVSSYNGKFRDYEKSPIYLKVGETIDDNTPYFYADDGTNMTSVYTTSKYTVTVEEAQIPTDEELTAAGINKSDYHVIGFDANDRKLKVTALNPGVVYLTVKTKDDAEKSRTQKIVVENTVESVTLECDAYNEGFCDGKIVTNNLTNEVDKILFYANYKLKYPSLTCCISANTLSVAGWDLYKKNSEGKYERVENTTGEGLILYLAKSDSYKILDDGTWRYGYGCHVGKNATGGDYAIHGTVDVNKVIIDGGSVRRPVIKDADKDELPGPCKFALTNLNSNGEALGYQFTGCSWTEAYFAPTTVTFKFTKPEGEYYYEPLKILGNADDCLILKENPEGSGEYELSFNPDKTSAEIAKFLSDKGSCDNCYVTVESIFGKSKDTAVKYSRKINIAGRFTVGYKDTEGMTQLPTSYYLPKNYNYKPDGSTNMVWVYAASEHEDPVLKTPTRDGYDFAWYNAADNKIIRELGEPLGNLTLEARWGKQRSIIYELNEGTNDAGNPAKYSSVSDNIALKPASRVGYGFAGWYDDNNQKITDILATWDRDLKLTAHWAGNKYTNTLKYDTNGDTSVSENQIQTVTYPNTSCTFTVSANTLLREGYTYNWYTEKTGGEKIGETITVGENNKTENQSLTIYGRWDPIVYQISYDLDGGTVKKSNPSEYTVESDTITLNAPEKEGYRFIGWTGSNGAIASSEVTIEKGTVGDKEYKANWEKTEKPGTSTKSGEIDITELVPEKQVVKTETSDNCEHIITIADRNVSTGAKVMPAIGFTITDSTGAVHDISNLQKNKDYKIVYKNNKNANMVYDYETKTFKEKDLPESKKPYALIVYKGALKSLGLESDKIYFNIYPSDLDDAVITTKAKNGVIKVKAGKKIKFFKKAIIKNSNGKKYSLKKTDIDAAKTRLVPVDENGNPDLTAEGINENTIVKPEMSGKYVVAITGAGNFYSTTWSEVITLEIQ